MRRRRPPTSRRGGALETAAGVRVCRNPHKWVASWLLSCFSLSRLFLSGCLPAFLYLALFIKLLWLFVFTLCPLSLARSLSSSLGTCLPAFLYLALLFITVGGCGYFISLSLARSSLFFSGHLPDCLSLPSFVVCYCGFLCVYTLPPACYDTLKLRACQHFAP